MTLFKFRFGSTFTLQDGQYLGSSLFGAAENDDQVGFDELARLAALTIKDAAHGPDDLPPAGQQLIAAFGEEIDLHAEVAIVIN